jgi:hypothetical protein
VNLLLKATNGSSRKAQQNYPKIRGHGLGFTGTLFGYVEVDAAWRT